MKITPRLTGTDAVPRLARRLEDRLESGAMPRLEGRFKDGRDRAAGPHSEVSGAGGDLRRAPRPEPRVTRHRT